MEVLLENGTAPEEVTAPTLPSTGDRILRWRDQPHPWRAAFPLTRVTQQGRAAGVHALRRRPTAPPRSRSAWSAPACGRCLRPGVGPDSVTWPAAGARPDTRCGPGASQPPGQRRSRSTRLTRRPPRSIAGRSHCCWRVSVNSETGAGRVRPFLQLIRNEDLVAAFGGPSATVHCVARGPGNSRPSCPSPAHGLPEWRPGPPPPARPRLQPVFRVPSWARGGKGP